MNILSKRLFVTIFCTSFTPQVLAPGGTEDYEPCADDYMVTYLNRDDVKKAVHAESSIEWMECATQLHYNMADRLIPMQPIYLELLKSDAGLNILVYSGDDDAVCGTIGTQEWIWGLGYSPVSKEETWKTWSYADQVAGYATKFNIDTGKDNSLAFVTVFGSYLGTKMWSVFRN
jgi:serine carboxypeptidase-like clade II